MTPTVQRKVIAKVERIHPPASAQTTPTLAKVPKNASANDLRAPLRVRTPVASAASSVASSPARKPFVPTRSTPSSVTARKRQQSTPTAASVFSQSTHDHSPSVRASKLLPSPELPPRNKQSLRSPPSVRPQPFPFTSSHSPSSASSISETSPASKGRDSGISIPDSDIVPSLTLSEADNVESWKRKLKEQEAEKDREREARTNRKILDLEISNASLLAVNATLEKTKSKQHQEIRDLRRRIRDNAFVLPSPSLSATSSSLTSSPKPTFRSPLIDDYTDDENDMPWDDIMAQDPAFADLATRLEALHQSALDAIASTAAPVDTELKRHVLTMSISQQEDSDPDFFRSTINSHMTEPEAGINMPMPFDPGEFVVQRREWGVQTDTLELETPTLSSFGLTRSENHPDLASLSPPVPDTSIAASSSTTSLSTSSSLSSISRYRDPSLSISPPETPLVASLPTLSSSRWGMSSTGPGLAGLGGLFGSWKSDSIQP